MFKYAKIKTKFIAIFSLSALVCISFLYAFAWCNIQQKREVYCFKLSSIKENIIEETENNQNNVEENTVKVENTEQVDEINMYKSNKWRIKIPTLKIDAPIAEGTSQESMRRTVGHFETSSKWNGNVALAAHNRGYRCNFFQEIKKLKNGDTIVYSTDEGERTYKVVLNKIIKETDWSYVEDTKDNRITLITCEENKREYRRCIQAVEI